MTTNPTDEQERRKTTPPPMLRDAADKKQRYSRFISSSGRSSAVASDEYDYFYTSLFRARGVLFDPRLLSDSTDSASSSSVVVAAVRTRTIQKRFTSVWWGLSFQDRGSGEAAAGAGCMKKAV